MKRIASIWLPHLAIERWERTADCPPDAPVVLTLEGAHGLIIHAVTKAAGERGAHAGVRLTDARTLDPTLIAIAADPAGDAALVAQLAQWAGRWSPLVEVDGDGLRFDITGIAHLFGSERGLATDVRRCFDRIGLTAHIAIAPTAAAAWALARHSPCICRHDQIKSKLEALPAAALRLDSDLIRTLERLGLKTIGSLARVPRLALSRRFRGADDVINALDRAFGLKAEPLTAAPINVPPRASLRLEEPATNSEAASQVLEPLIADLVCKLEQRRLGARKLTLTGYRVDGSVAVTSVATAIPSREPKHLQRLLADKAAALNPEFGFDAFALFANWTEDLGAAQETLIDEPSNERELARLVDRLAVKLGSDAVRQPNSFESHLPERANGWISALQFSPVELSKKGHRRRPGGPAAAPRPSPSSVDGTPYRSVPKGIRPQRLFDRPEAIAVIYATPEGMPRRFMWRRATHDIARVEGPERIAPEWWRQPSSARLRDYYRIEDAQGRRYWIYREGLIGDGRGGPPNWFIHGLFG